MSETVHYKGKIQLVPKLENETLEDVCKRIMNEYDCFELDSYCNTWREFMADELYERYVVINDDVYEVTDKKYFSDEYDIFKAHKVSDTEYEYEVMYYNGGCSFEEAIEEAFNQMNGE